MAKAKRKKIEKQSQAKGSLMTAREACAFLGIKPQTLYAYVSRGQLRAEPARKDSGAAGNLYARDELEALKSRSLARSGHGPTAASAMRWGEPILDSAITCIQNGMVYYRGHGLNDLLRRSTTFENVAELLWSGELPSQAIQWELQNSTKLKSRDTTLTNDDDGTQVARRLFSCLSSIALADQTQPRRDELLDDSLRRARSLTVAVATELFNLKINTGAALNLAEAMARELQKTSSKRRDDSWREAAVAAINGALIASADHELNASTFAARIAASTGADLYACVLAGATAFSGKRHGLSPIEAHHTVTAAQALPIKNLPAFIAQRLEQGVEVAGFGHRLYPEGDPRAKLLFALARQLAAHTPKDGTAWIDFIEQFASVAASQGLPPANLDLGLVAIAGVLGMPPTGASCLFVTGRITGWTAHVLEQRQQGFLLRPRARYIGRAPHCVI